jgi:hypothetical protein
MLTGWSAEAVAGVTSIFADTDSDTCAPALSEVMMAAPLFALSTVQPDGRMLIECGGNGKTVIGMLERTGAPEAIEKEPDENIVGSFFHS